MVKLISQLIGAKILLFQERARIGEIAEVIIDPKDGAFVGFKIFEEPQNIIKYIAPSEIKGLGSGFVLVKDLNSLSEEGDVVRIAEVIEDSPEIIASRVYTTENEYVGKVEDATINFKLLSLEKLYVAPKMSLKFLTENLIIGAKQIVKIEKKKILIQNGNVKIKKGVLSPQIAPLAE